jgi:ssDNA-binding Zn-finger/Zn-ribbon topoisomerase 1
MAKLQCICGHIIVDQTDNLPYKAYFLPDEDEETCFVTTVNQIKEFIRARERGQAREMFEVLLGPNDDELNAIDVFVFSQVIPMRTSYECEKCGRLWIEFKEGKYTSYFPENEAKGVLRSIKSRSSG